MYKNNIAYFFLFFILPGITNQAKAQAIQGKWNGNVGMVQVGTGITGSSVLRLDATIRDNVVTATMSFDGDLKIATLSQHISCMGAGPGILNHLDLDRQDSVFYIHVIGADFTCNPKDAGPGVDAVDITITDKVNGDFNYLHGSRTDITDIPNTAKVTTTYTWNLHQGPVDAQLIITPVDYDIWMPKASPDELRKGSVMDIKLDVQGRNRGNPSLKVERFELRLSNTSMEPGTTLNMPLSPASNQLPDIRFIPHTIGESIEPDQYIEITSEDHRTGTATLASYDGGGWTTLTAVAILEGGIRIEGKLLAPNGPTEVPIPKRPLNSKIATVWLAANGYPAEKQDMEKKGNNPNPGDGLTAYEEYRGVISKGEFTRLKATEKELGVMVKRQEASLFDEGIGWLENASGLKVIRFDETEIGTDRKLNKNFLSAHDYDQYVLKLENTGLAGDVMGENQPENVKEKIPKQSERIVIDVNKIRTNYQTQAQAAAAGNIRMPYTEAEDLANTVAHELAHGIHVIHHGKSWSVPPRKAYATSDPPFRIFWFDNTEETVRPYPVPVDQYLETTGETGNDESGDLTCIMAYTSLYNWAFRKNNTDGSLYYYKVPLLPVGKKLCTSKTGTGINAPSNKGVNNVNKYFGNAENGNCLSQIKLRD